MSCLKNKNTHLNQAIHEEQEAILELRVQLRLLQNQKLQQELTVQPPPDPAPPTQPSPEAHSEEQTKRTVTTVAANTDTAAPVASANGKAAKDPPKPSPSKDRRDANKWQVGEGYEGCCPVVSPVIHWRLHVTWSVHLLGVCFLVAVM